MAACAVLTITGDLDLLHFILWIRPAHTDLDGWLETELMWNHSELLIADDKTIISGHRCKWRKCWAAEWLNRGVWVRAKAENNAFTLHLNCRNDQNRMRSTSLSITRCIRNWPDQIKWKIKTWESEGLGMHPGEGSVTQRAGWDCTGSLIWADVCEEDR